MDQKTLVIVGTLLTIVLGVIASLVAWFCGGNKLEGTPREAIRLMLNFEICFFVLAIVLNLIPIIGQLAVLGLWIVSIVFAIKAFNAAEKNEAELKIPCIEFIK